MKRIFDLTLALVLLIPLLPLLVLASLFVIIMDGAPAWFWSRRFGKNSQLFLMPKLRSMKKETPQLATHLLSDGRSYLIKGGEFLRRSSLDELPQLVSILLGYMSFVGPRPALFNQTDLMEMRQKFGVDKLTPGLTGWAQINGRDALTLEEKVKLEKFYLENQSVFFDLKILWRTAFKVLGKKDITH